MSEIAIQLFVLREHDASLPELIRSVADAGFDGVEFAFRLPDADIDDVRVALDETRTEAASAHVPIEWLEDDFETTVERYKSLNCDTLIVPSLPPETFETMDGIENAATRLNDLAKRLAEHNFRLGYHNHDQEMVTVDGELAMDKLVDATNDDVLFQIDLASARRGDADPVALLKRVGNRTHSIHFYDDSQNDEESVRFGDGDLPLREGITAALQADIEWVIYEGDYTKDTLEGAAESIADLLESSGQTD